MTLFYVEKIHMLEGLEDNKLEKYLDEKPQIVPLTLQGGLAVWACQC